MKKMISLILLASGFGKRFGGNKLLFEIDGKPMYRNVLDRLCELSNNNNTNNQYKIIVVTRYDEICSYCRELGIESLINNDANKGISTSVKMGVEAASDSEWLFFFVADQPYLERDTIEGFITATLNSNMTMSSVKSGDRPGNPTGFHIKWKQKLLELYGDSGGRRLLKENPEEIFWYEVPARELEDIDYLNEGEKDE